MIKNKSFCSLIVGKGQNILFEKYAKDFKRNQPQTIMSITKMFINLFVGKLVKNKSIDEKLIVIETLTCIKRSGASSIITYYAKEVAQWLN